jgi:uncharacterized protein
MEPFTLLIKPSGSDCNINCKYCFYKNRAAEFGCGRQRMSDEVLEKLIKDYMQLNFPVVGFAWQGGEPTLMGVDFLCRIFDRWYEYGHQKLNIREFDSLVTYFVMGSHTICTYNKQCTGFVVIEHTGDAFCCEFFVEPKWRLGNILETKLEKLAAGNIKRTFARNKQNLSGKCLVCRYLDICRGGCMKDRVRWNDNLSRESYFCESYKQLFDYTLPRFMQIAAAIKTGLTDRHTRSVDKVRLII